MRFWKEHTALRAGLIALFFVAGLALVIGGWRMTGQMTGLLIMVAGLASLVVALALYNKPFQDDPREGRK